MNERGKARLVYSTGVGRVCPGCGWPTKECTCSTRAGAGALAARQIVAILRTEKKGRGGKTVTVVAGLPNNETWLRNLCQELKRACGSGGSVKEDTIELQGDLRDRVREHLVRKEFVVKG